MAKVKGKAVGGRVRIEVDLSDRDLKGFCATGDGGGIDNSCGREGGGRQRESYNDRIEGTQAEADREVKRATAKVRKVKEKISSLRASAAANRKVDIAKRTVDILQGKLDEVRARKEEIAAKLAALRANRKKSTEAELETALAAVAKDAAAIAAQCDKLLADLETKSFCPNGPGGGIDPTCSPHTDGGGSAGIVGAWKNTSPKTAAELSGVTPDFKVKTITKYHATRIENVSSILRGGFDLTKVRPRWQNDYAVSTATARGASEFFSKRNPKTGKPEPFDATKYALLEVKVRGRFPTHDEFSGPSLVGTARDYTKRVVDAGVDGQTAGDTIYIYNTQAILSIRVVDAPARKAFCPTGPGGGIDPTCSPRMSAHDDSGGGGPAKLSANQWKLVYALPDDGQVYDIPKVGRGVHYPATKIRVETVIVQNAKDGQHWRRRNIRGFWNPAEQVDGLERSISSDKAFCPTGPGGGVDPTCSPRMSAHDDSGGGSPEYKQTMVGEFWLDGGSSMFADGDVGEMNHEAYAVDRAMRDVISSAGDEYSDFLGDDFPDWDGFREAFLGDNPGIETKTGKNETTLDSAKLAELGIDADDWDVASGFGDPRAHAIEKWGWVRVAGNNVQMNTISKSEMKTLADGLGDAYSGNFDMDDGDDDHMMRQSFNIETKRDFYEDVPYPVLESGDMSELRQYKRPGVSGWGGGKSAEARGILATKVFCPTGPGGGVDPTCSPGGRRGSGGDGPASPTGPATDPTTPCPEAPCYEPNVYHDSNGDGVTEAARVGVPAHMMPPPPPIPRLKNLTAEEREAETKFAEAFEQDPEGMTAKFLALVEPKEGPPVFETDMAKLLSEDWNDKDPQAQMAKRHSYNTPLHQTANAIAKRAFVDHLDTLPPGANVLVTVGGCGAGKGFALSKTTEGAELKSKAAVVWDSAGDQNATENGWVLKEARSRGLTVTYAYVHNDPEVSWAHPERGVVQRATDPKNGRMVDAAVFADSYAIGARNHAAFHANHANVKDVKFVFVRNGKTPEAIPGVPPEAFVDRDRLYEFAKRTVRERTDLPATIKRGALVGERIWGEKL